MKQFILLLVLISTLRVHGQTPGLWNQILAGKDLAPFKQFTGQESYQEDKDKLDTLYFRTLCDDFYEGLFIYDRWVGDTRPGGLYRISYQFRVITRRDKIIYARLLEDNKKAADDPDSLRFAERAFYQDSVSYSLLHRSFRQTFGADIKASELLRDNIEFSHGCGFGSTPSDERVLMDTLIVHKDKAAILSWLQSANTERQLYGLDASYQLKRQGLPITRFEQDLIKKISAKKGTINSCAAYRHGRPEIHHIIHQVKHRPKEVADRTGLFNYDW
ncbi:hypothetical protein [Taibaiella chishuiensis]|uniref:hypothetical protein n=1 Tax=Taibaiella chishuiensis TaxID=1434707 RepID=UPI000D0CCA0C|nr:hypothetical protein [Taibaiella chishuiensis]